LLLPPAASLALVPAAASVAFEATASLLFDKNLAFSKSP
jgi:hypothetical protein